MQAETRQTREPQKLAAFMRLDSRARLIYCLILGIAFLIALSLTALGYLFLPVILATALARIPIKPYLRNLLVPLPFLLILAVLQVFFNANTAVSPVLFQVGKNIITPHDIQNGAMLLVRFAGLVGVISLAALILKPSETARAFESMLSPLMKLKIPTQDLALMMLVTLRFIPLLQQTASRIARAQTARGADWGGHGGGIGARVSRIIPVIIPLFVNTLQRSENLAAAMQSRGYSSTQKRTALMPMHFRTVDGVVVILMLIFVSAVMVLV